MVLMSPSLRIAKQQMIVQARSLHKKSTEAPRNYHFRHKSCLQTIFGGSIYLLEKQYLRRPTFFVKKSNMDIQSTKTREDLQRHTAHTHTQIEDFTVQSWDWIQPNSVLSLWKTGKCLVDASPAQYSKNFIAEVRTLRMRIWWSVYNCLYNCWPYWNIWNYNYMIKMFPE